MKKVRQFVGADCWERDLEGGFVPLRVDEWTITRHCVSSGRKVKPAVADELVVALKWHTLTITVQLFEGWLHLRDFGLAKDFTVNKEKISQGSFRQELGSKCGITIGDPSGEYRVRLGDRFLTDGAITPIEGFEYVVKGASYCFIRYRNTSKCSLYLMNETLTPGRVVLDCAQFRKARKRKEAENEVNT